MKRTIAANKPLVVVVAAVVVSGIMATFVYGVSPGSAALMVLLKGAVFGVGLLIVWLAVKRAQRRQPDDEVTIEVGDAGERS